MYSLLLALPEVSKGVLNYLWYSRHEVFPLGKTARAVARMLRGEGVGYSCIHVLADEFLFK